jgi:hypothetical protein
MSHVLTGTWEEIKSHGAEQLVGRYMTVVVHDRQNEALAETSVRLAAFDAWIAAPRPQGLVLLDDSRLVIYGDDEDRGTTGSSV